MTASSTAHRWIAADHRDPAPAHSDARLPENTGLGISVGTGRRASVVICHPLIHLVRAAHPIPKSLISARRGDELLPVRRAVRLAARRSHSPLNTGATGLSRYRGESLNLE